ncbi:hypothetical protein HaLaN_09412, partial [Haematococcus lacustris]
MEAPNRQTPSTNCRITTSAVGPTSKHHTAEHLVHPSLPQGADAASLRRKMQNNPPYSQSTYNTPQQQQQYLQQQQQ